MNLRYGLKLLLIASVVASAWAGAAIAKKGWPKFPTPPDTKVASAAADMVFNGVPMSVDSFTRGDWGVEDTLSFYRKEWTVYGRPKPVENDLGEWKVIGSQDGEFYMTVQAKPWREKGSQGFMAISLLPALKEKPELGSGFPALDGSKVVNDIKSSDAGKNARTVLLKNGESLSTNLAFYRGSYKNQGWETVSDKTAHAGDSASLLYRRGVAEANIIIKKEKQGSTIIANVVENGRANH